MKPQIGDIRAVAQRFNGEEWVNCLQGFPRLTNQEIQEVYSKQHEIPCNILGFARAILRKAQEK